MNPVKAGPVSASCRAILRPEGAFQQGKRKGISPYSALVYSASSRVVVGVGTAQSADLDSVFDFAPEPGFLLDFFLSIRDPNPAMTNGG